MCIARLLFAGSIAIGASCSGLSEFSFTPEDPLPSEGPGPITFQSRLLARIPDDTICDRFYVNRGGTAVAYVGNKNGHFFVVHKDNWRLTPETVHGPWLSQDGDHIAYEEEGKFFVDGKPWDVDGRIVLAFSSPDGMRFAAIGKHGQKDFMVVDGERSEDFDYVSWPTFSPDGKHVAYCARSGQRQWVILDGRKQEEYEPYEWVVLIGRANVLAPSKPEVNLPKPVFSADSQSLAYPAAQNGECFVVVNGQRGEAFEYVIPPIWSPLAKRLAYIAQKGGKTCVVVDGVKGEFFDQVPGPLFCANPVFSEDGSTLAYLAVQGKKHLLVSERRGTQEVPYPRVHALDISPRGGRMAVVVGRLDSRTLKGALGKALVVVDGQEGPGRDVIPYGMAFSPNGARLAYESGPIGRRNINVDDRQGEGFDGVKLPQFSPDSQHFAHWAKRGKEHYLVVDGQPGEPYDEVLTWPIHFSQDSTQVAFAARKGRDILWVVRKL